MLQEAQITGVGRDVEPHKTSTGHDSTSPDWPDGHFVAMQPEYEEKLR
jgi:hypothetical protein